MRLYDDENGLDTYRQHVAARRAPDCRSQSDQPSSIGQQAAGITLYAGRATDGDAPQGAGVSCSIFYCESPVCFMYTALK